MIDVQVKAVGGDSWESISSFIGHQEREIDFLTQQIARFKEILQTMSAN